MSVSNCNSGHSYLVRKFESVSGEDDVDHYPALYYSTPEEYKLHAEQALNETEKRKVMGVKELTDYIHREGIECPDENIFVMVLRYCKYNIERAKPRLKKFLKFRGEITNVISKMEKKSIEAIIDDNMMGILPYRDRYGRVIVFTRENIHLENYTLDEMVACLFVFWIFLLSFPMTSICGVAYLADCKYSSQYFLFTVLSRKLSYILSSLLDFPFRFQTVHIFNELFLIRWFYKGISPFVPSKIRKRVFFHGRNVKNLQEDFHEDIVPIDSEGTLGPISNTFYREKLLDFIQTLINEKN